MNLSKEQEQAFLNTYTPASLDDYKKHIRLLRDNNLFDKSDEEIHQFFTAKYPHVISLKVKVLNY